MLNIKGNSNKLRSNIIIKLTFANESRGGGKAAKTAKASKRQQKQ